MAPVKSSLSKPSTSYSTGPLAGTPPIPWGGGVYSSCLSSEAGCCCARLSGERPPACGRAWPRGACPCTLRLSLWPPKPGRSMDQSLSPITPGREADHLLSIAEPIVCIRELVVNMVRNHGNAPSQWCDRGVLYPVLGAAE